MPFPLTPDPTDGSAFPYGGNRYYHGSVPKGGSSCEVCSQSLDAGFQAYVTGYVEGEPQKTIDTWCGLDVIRGDVTGSRRSASSTNNRGTQMNKITEQARARAARRLRATAAQRTAENIQDIPEKGSESPTAEDAAAVSEDTSVDGTGGGVVGDDGSVTAPESVTTPAAPDMSNDSLSPESPSSEEVDVEKEVNNAGDTTQDTASQTVDPDTGEFTNESFPQNVSARKVRASDEEDAGDDEMPEEFLEQQKASSRRREAALRGRIRSEVEERVFASLRLAGLRAQAGLSQGDLVDAAQEISKSAASMEAIRVETSTLTALAQRAPQQRSASRAPQRGRLATTASAPSLASSAPTPARGHSDDLDDSWLG